MGSAREGSGAGSTGFDFGGLGALAGLLLGSEVLGGAASVSGRDSDSLGTLLGLWVFSFFSDFSERSGVSSGGVFDEDDFGLKLLCEDSLSLSFFSFLLGAGAAGSVTTGSSAASPSLADPAASLDGAWLFLSRVRVSKISVLRTSPFAAIDLRDLESPVPNNQSE